MRKLIHKGGLLNARVYRVQDGTGKVWIEKDFSENPWFVRNTVGRFLIARECRILRQLEPSGIVPTGVCRISAFAMREDFCQGFTLRDSCCGVHSDNHTGSISIDGVPQEMLDSPIPRKFFEALEAGMRAIHALGFVHLDMHNERNIIVGSDYRPVILDWQSALPFAKLPIIGRLLRRIDYSGILKFWDRFRPGELDWKHSRQLKRSRFIRNRFWIPRIRL